MIGLLAIPLVLSANAGAAVNATEESHILSPITVTARRVANLQPASSYASMATELRFDPQVNLQARGLAEGQADITIRGGLFENTGFRLGATTILDPQTGHYSVEIPFDPSMLTSPEIMTDVDNGMNSFNASIATVNYGFSRVSEGGNLTAGLGSDSLFFATVNTAFLKERDDDTSFGTTISASGSRGDGSLPDGDHDFKRFSGHLQYLNNGRETNFLLGYHDKFQAWPGMYTGFASLPETDRTKLGLAVLNHRWTTAQGWWEIGSAYRWLENDYDFDSRTEESGTPGSFEHETRNVSIAISGLHRSGNWDWYFNGQFTADRLVRSTDLTFGDFNSRSFGMISIAPGRSWRLESGADLSVRAGLRGDFSNRDENAASPIFALALEQSAGSGLNRYRLDYSEATQLPGYTALNSRPQGLFGGNPDLGREYARTLTLGFEHENSNWLGRAAVFRRDDDDLVDWTYRQGAPFVRQANAVDMEVTGLEALLSWQSSHLELTGGYAWIEKDADYGETELDASYYALNYAEHRLTLAIIYHPITQLEFRLDNEYRRQHENLLRTSRDSAWLASFTTSWQPDSIPWLGLMLAADNLSDSDFQEFPGTPPMGRTVSLAANIDW